MKDNKTKRKSLSYGKIVRRNIFLTSFVIIAFICVGLFTPVFNIRCVYVTGNEMLADEDVIKASKIQAGDNLFLTNTKKAKENVKKLGYVDSVEINRKFFADIEIKVKECTETAYISFAGNYIGIDDDAKVISITKSSKLKPKKTVITGYAIKNAAKGSFADSKDELKGKALKSILNSLKEGKLISKTKKIDMSDINKIKFVLNSDTSVILGKDDQTDYKIKCLKAVLDELGEIRGGKINVSDPSNVIYEGGNQK